MKIHKIHEIIYEPDMPITINLIGLGGNGLVVLHNLVKMHLSLKGLGHSGLALRIFDPDIIDIHNIGRQMFSHADLGQYKAQVIAQRYQRSYDGFLLGDFNKRYQGEYPANITISCVDTVKSRIEILNYLKIFPFDPVGNVLEQCLYWLDLGNSKNSGQFVLGTINTNYKRKEKEINRILELKNVINLYPNILDVQDNDEPSCSLIESLGRQDLFINPILGNFACHMIWRLIREGYLTYHGAHINLESMNISTINL